MTEVVESVDVRAPLGFVFEHVTDPRRGPEWNPNIVEVHPPTAPLAPGTTWRQTVSVLGRIMHVSCEVVCYEPPTYGEIRVSGDHTGRLWTRCERRDDRTCLLQGIEFEPPGGKLRGLVGKAAAGTIRRELRATMARQRETLERESGGTDGPGA